MVVPDTAIYETDVENDFALRSGALFVRANKPKTHLPYGAEERLPNIFALHEHADVNNWLILGSVDRHFYEDVELIRNAGGVFDDHCMNGTKGQLRLPELEPQKDIYIRAKDGPFLGVRNYTEAELAKYLEAANKGMHLIFEKQSYDVGTNPNFVPTLKQAIALGLRKIVTNGFATDYCDLAALLKMADVRDQYCPELKLYIVTDAIEAVNIDFNGQIDNDFGKKALEKMAARGVKLVTTKDVLENRL
jgi:nicotinamidase-related amidase